MIAGFLVVVILSQLGVAIVRGAVQSVDEIVAAVRAIGELGVEHFEGAELSVQLDGHPCHGLIGAVVINHHGVLAGLGGSANQILTGAVTRAIVSGIVTGERIAQTSPVINTRKIVGRIDVNGPQVIDQLVRGASERIGKRLIVRSSPEEIVVLRAGVIQHTDVGKVGIIRRVFPLVDRVIIPTAADFYLGARRLHGGGERHDKPEYDSQYHHNGNRSERQTQVEFTCHICTSFRFFFTAYDDTATLCHHYTIRGGASISSQVMRQSIFFGKLRKMKIFARRVEFSAHLC